MSLKLDHTHSAQIASALMSPRQLSSRGRACLCLSDQRSRLRFVSALLLLLCSTSPLIVGCDTPPPPEPPIPDQEVDAELDLDPPPACGDQVINQVQEECDDGNSDDGDGCRNDCTLARCGDGVRRADLSEGEEGYEECDDGDQINTDACTTSCRVATCGDGILRQDLRRGALGFEECDDGDSDDLDECRNHCEIARCGDGVARMDVDSTGAPYETCDDGNDIESDGCHNDCRVDVCGDGVVKSDPVLGDPEECDDGNLNPLDGCTDECLINTCGDGILWVGREGCDEGADQNLPGGECTELCQRARCGDGRVLEGVEECDDGNENNLDDCLNSCVRPRCGDGILSVGEACDYAILDGPPCEADENGRCRLIECGDGFVQSGEECDDGVDQNGADRTCTDRCLVARCGDGRVRADLDPNDDGYEECDEGLDPVVLGAGFNLPNQCSAQCKLPYCGDGVIDTITPPDSRYPEVLGEECDPASTNLNARCRSVGDPSGAACTLKRCGDGIVDLDLGEQCDDANLIQDDGCHNDCQKDSCGDGVRQRVIGESGHGVIEECDWGANNSDEPDHCRDSGSYTPCHLPHCGDGVVDTGEECDDQNEDATDGCHQCLISWCGNSVREDYLPNGSLLDNATAFQCNDDVLYIREQCDQTEGCDALCSMREYDFGLAPPQNGSTSQGLPTLCAPYLRFPYQSVDVYESDRYHFTLTEERFVRFDARRALSPQARCVGINAIGEYELRFKLYRARSDTTLEDVTERLSGREDATLCASLQGMLSPGDYLLEVSGAEREDLIILPIDPAEGVEDPQAEAPQAEEDDTTRSGGPTQRVDGYSLDMMLSRELSRGRHDLSTVSRTTPSIFHLQLSREMISVGETHRAVRFVWPASERDSTNVDLNGCPRLTALRLATDNLASLTPETQRFLVSAEASVDPLSATTCSVELDLVAGLYLFEVDHSESAHQALYVQWPELCENGELDLGEICDLGTSAHTDTDSLSRPCSKMCMDYPRGVERDGVCDQLSGESIASADCEATCVVGLEEGLCLDHHWVSGHLERRVTQPHDSAYRISFTLTANSLLDVNLSDCSDAPIQVLVRRLGPEGAATEELIATQADELADELRAVNICAHLSAELNAGAYELEVSLAQDEALPPHHFSYWIDAIKTRSLEGFPQLVGVTSLTSDRNKHLDDEALDDEPLGDLYTLDLSTPMNVEVSIYDDDDYLQCESKSQYGLHLLARDQLGLLVRSVDGELFFQSSPEVMPDRAHDFFGTGPLNQDVPCVSKIFNLNAGRHVFEVRPATGVDAQPYRIRTYTPRACGDATLDAGEECDDGNLEDGDGCSKTCVTEVICGDGVINRLEECDDGNTIGGDLRCGETCLRCGNGVLDIGEECDDGNLIAGDGCDALCTLEIIEIKRGLFSRSSVIAQRAYTTDAVETRSLFERADVYSVEISEQQHLKAWLCAPRRVTADPEPDPDPNPEPDPEPDLTNLIAARLLLMPDPRDQDHFSLEDVSLDNASLMIEAQETDSTPQADLFQLCDGLNDVGGVELSEADMLTPISSFSPPSSDPDLTARGLTDQACVSVEWSYNGVDKLTPGRYWLIVDAQEERARYRDQPIPYELHTMNYRALWSDCEVGLGVLKGSIVAGGDHFFELKTPCHKEDCANPNEENTQRVYEIRTLEDAHSSCPVDTATMITVSRWHNDAEVAGELNGASDRCEVIYHFPGSPCDAARVELYGDERYLIRVSSADPEEATRRYGLKVRQLDRCGDGVLDWGEACDDKNRYDLDACTKLCTHSEGACGDGVLNGVEECDDGNLLNNDDCSTSCQSEIDIIRVPQSFYQYQSREATPQVYRFEHQAQGPSSLQLDLQVEPGYRVRYQLDGQTLACPPDTEAIHLRDSVRCTYDEEIIDNLSGELSALELNILSFEGREHLSFDPVYQVTLKREAMLNSLARSQQGTLSLGGSNRYSLPPIDQDHTVALSLITEPSDDLSSCSVTLALYQSSTIADYELAELTCLSQTKLTFVKQVELDSCEESVELSIPQPEDPGVSYIVEVRQSELEPRQYQLEFVQTSTANPQF